MTTASATSAAIVLCPGKTVICVERYQSTHHMEGERTERFDCTISVSPSLNGEPGQSGFYAPSFEQCLADLQTAIKANV